MAWGWGQGVKLKKLQKKKRGSSLRRDSGSRRQSAEEKKAEERTGLAVETRRAVGRAADVTLNLASAGGAGRGGLSAGLLGLSSSRGLPCKASPERSFHHLSLCSQNGALTGDDGNGHSSNEIKLQYSFYF